MVSIPKLVFNKLVDTFCRLEQVAKSIKLMEIVYGNQI